MGASVRTEDEAFSDERYADLAAFAGLADADHARGKMERLWRQCTIETRYSLPAETITRILGANGVDAIVRARLGEQLDDGTVRIKGTKGRIEWLKKLRKNGRFGKLGGRPKKNPPGYPPGVPQGSANETPPSPSPVPSPVPTDPEKNPPNPPSGGMGASELVPTEPRPKSPRPRKPKPSDPTPDETAIALRVLAKLTDRTGVSYKGSAPHVRLIADRLREGVTERELRGIAAYCWSPVGKGWEQKPEMHQYLCPETLYGPKTIHRYLPGTRAFLAEHYPEAPTAPNEAA